MMKDKFVGKELRRYSIKTDKNNSVIVEEINQSELESVWNTLSDIEFLF